MTTNRICIVGWLLFAGACAGWAQTGIPASAADTGKPTIIAGAQQITPSIPACKPRDLFATPRFSTGPDDFFTVAYDFRNISDHDCNMVHPGYAPSFVPDRAQGTHPIGYKRSPMLEKPLLLGPGQTDHLAYRWRTTASDTDHPCVRLKWMAGFVLITTATLLRDVCSDVEGGYYESGPFGGQAEGISVLLLSAPKSSFFLEEQFFLTVAGPRQSIDEAAPCPTLFLLQRSPDGSTRFDELKGNGFEGCKPAWLARPKGNWNAGFPIESGAGSYWSGVGEHQFELFEQVPTQDGADPAFRHTQILTLQIADPSEISRKWSKAADGVATDISLDKVIYRQNEDVPLHLAVENFTANGAVHSWDPGWDPCSAISIRVLDEHGDPLPTNSRQGRNVCRGHGFGMTKEFLKGEGYPIERSLIREGWLPKKPGNYTIVVTWAPLIGSSHEHTPVQARANFTIVPSKN